MTVEQHLGIEGLADDEAEYLTLAGYLLERFGRLPTAGDRHEEFGYAFEVTVLEKNRIAEVRITRLPKAEDPEA